MNKDWDQIPLGELLIPRQETPLDEELVSGEVKIVSKIKFDNGKIEFRSSSDTKTGMIRICPGDLVFSGINAAKGAIAIYPSDSEQDAAATIHYSSYIVNKEKADIKFLWWLLRSAEFKRILNNYLPGGIKTELKAKRLLPIPVPLPVISEQKRIVMHLDNIQDGLTRLKKLREFSANESHGLLRSFLNEQHCKDIQFIPMRDIVTWRSPDIVVSQEENYRFAGVYSFGRGVFRKDVKAGTDFSYDRLTRLRAREFTYPKLMAWEGALGVVPEDCDGCHVSPEFPVFSIDESKVLPEIIDIHFKSPAVWRKLADISTGTNLRRRRLNPKAFLGYEFPLPPMKIQKHIKRISELAAIKRAEQQRATELESTLLPSILNRVFS
ncbi:MAG: restriction endonuclease subunit S [Gammaproteobacteria bacterium]